MSFAYVVARRIRAYPFLDAWAVAFAAAHVVEKLACLTAGCCFGRSTDSILGVALHASHGDPTRVQPLPFYEASLHLLTALGLGLLYARGRFKGQLMMVLGAVFGFWRSAIELARAGRRSPFMDGPLTITQVVYLVAIAFCFTYLGLCRADRHRPEPAAAR